MKIYSAHPEYFKFRERRESTIIHTAAECIGQTSLVLTEAWHAGYGVENHLYTGRRLLCFFSAQNCFNLNRLIAKEATLRKKLVKVL